MMKVLLRAFTTCCLVGVLAGAYAAIPMWTAWSIREAIKDNDSGYLERKIEWTSVRTTLKDSLSKYSFTTSGELLDVPAKPGWWQQFKSYIGQGALDRFIETTVTPTGMNGLFLMRKAYNTTLAAEDAHKPPLWERVRRVWSRVTRAEFAAFHRFEMDMIDKAAPQRTIACVLELRGFEWKLTELRVKPTDPARIGRMVQVQPVMALQ